MIINYALVMIGSESEYVIKGFLFKCNVCVNFTIFCEHSS